MFFLLPVGVDYRTERFPAVTFTLIGLNTAIFILTFLASIFGGENSTAWILQNLWLVPSESTWHAYFTTLFVHAGFFHLLGNMIYLFLFGSCVEDILGRGKFIAFYLAGGLASDLAYILATPGNLSSSLPLGGASGAISACMGGFVLLFHQTKINFRYFVWFLRIWTGEFSLPAWLVITFWFGKDFLSAALDYVSAAASGVAFAAHVGGFISGFGMIAAFKSWRRWNESQEKSARRAAVAVIPGSLAAPGASSVYLFDAGTQLGPFTNAQIAQMLALGSVTNEALYWHEARQEWRSIAELQS